MRRLVFVAISSLLLACGDAGVVQLSDEEGAADNVTDAPLAGDLTEPDSALPDLGQPDATPADSGPPSTCLPGEGCFGEPCESADDCLTGICTLHLGDKVCSKTCDESCPEGWDCTLVGAGGDGQYVCMSKFGHLCLPCETSEGCAGDVPNACVKYADGTRFCGGACDLDTPCPSGYACQEVETADGANSYQCVNTAGVCPCSNLAIESALATSCEATNDVGTCGGVRVCEQTGLSDCSALEPTVEVCNGVDDDCNGLTDEGTCDDGNDCTIDACDGAEGCTYEPINEGECLDGDACTIADHCEDGVCVGQAVDCDDGNPCTASSCDGLGGCKHEAIVAICDDADPCTLGDICQDGACQGSATLTCDDGNPCTDDSCGEGGCVFTPNQAACDDGNACTATDACNEGMCTGEQVACDDGNLCTTDSCSVADGCVSANNTQPCDDGDGCTKGDVCADGACLPGALATCDDGNLCTDDTCDSQLGCIFSPNTDDCDDKNSCTTGDACVEGNCIGLGDLSCDDGNPCTKDVCLPNGGCLNSISEGACSDGDACTVNDSCVNGACSSGTLLSCDDGNPCTDEACIAGDCVFTANAADCDDDNACTTQSVCSKGACTATQSLDCDDKNACTSDACDPASGCLNINNEIQCTDADPCTIGDGCVDGACQPGAGILPCDDGNACTDDSCQKGQGCVFTPNTAPCDDGNACTSEDACADGWCVGGKGVVCDDENPCTDDICDIGEGCLSSPNVLPCDDGDSCTVGDTCAEGVCKSGSGTLVEICDGLDNDCDGETDEGFGSTTCGTGACLKTISNCDGGVAQVCDPFQGSSDEVCDGLDNDCDGNVDEEQGVTSCGLGECLNVVSNCEGGLSQQCDPFKGATDEICDGNDNDCDGDFDEDLGSTTCGQGECLKTVSNCEGGLSQTCDPLEGSSDEVCDGLDNDCDGSADEDLGVTSCGLGECLNVVSNCEGGLSQQCDPFKGATDEICDGNDNDCDGSIDEGDDLCGPDDVCTNGSCVPKCQPVDGGWSNYTCSGCSADCGGGIETCTRTCNNPAPSCGGAPCQGSSSKQESCNTNPCCNQVYCGFHYYCVYACVLGCGGCNVPGCSHNGWDCSGPGIKVNDYSDCNGVCP